MQEIELRCPECQVGALIAGVSLSDGALYMEGPIRTEGCDCFEKIYEQYYASSLGKINLYQRDIDADIVIELEKVAYWDEIDRAYDAWKEDGR